MRITAAIASIAILAPIALLAACTGGSQGPLAAVPSSNASLAANPFARALASPKSVPQGTVKPAAGTAPRLDMYVGDANANAVDVLRRGNYRDVTQIRNGVNGPEDVFLDSQGNLYVANYNTSNVTEYAPGNTTAPIFTYNTGIYVPYAVAADARGNVYEGDENGHVNEYFQQSNSVVASCLTGGYTLGVAVDANHDVFADVSLGESAELVEFPGGLGNCSGKTVLSASIAMAGGIAVDKNGNLLVAEGSKVAVISPPYTSASGTIGTGFSYASNVHLNGRNTWAFVTDLDAGTVTVVNYRLGTNRAVLGTADGLSSPTSADE
jgi:hypothetical protein